jgi:membrane protease YdiL (CAAX protease family)
LLVNDKSDTLMKKLFLYLSITTYILTVLPLPLAIWVDLTYHWLLLITLPFGSLLGTIFLIIWIMLKNKNKRPQ